MFEKNTCSSVERKIFFPSDIKSHNLFDWAVGVFYSKMRSKGNVIFGAMGPAFVLTNRTRQTSYAIASSYLLY